MKIIGLFLAFAAVIILAGCNETPVSTIPDDSFELSAQLIPPDVQRLFDQYALDINAQSGGEPALSTGFDADPGNSPFDAYVVTFIWGSLFNTASPNATHPLTDWSGSLAVDADGKIRVTRAISFETGQDYFLPETTPKVSAWVSWTAHDFDGVSFIILIARATPNDGAAAITFATAPFTLSLTAGQMARFAAFYPISNTAGIAVLSHKIPPINDCPSGLMIGNWVKADITGSNGTFSGLWIESNGDTTGVFSGMFWTENDGNRLFSGNVSGVVTTQIIAYLEGRWHYEDPRMCPVCGSGFGKFYGIFRYPNHNQFDGFIGGQFGSLGLPPDQLDLPLTGTWKAHCDNLAPSLQAVDQ